MSSPPVKYVRAANFTDFSTVHPDDQQPGVDLDVEYDDIAISLNKTIDRLGEIQRSDGALANLVVTPDSLSTSTKAMLGAEAGTPRGVWVTATAYAVKDLVAQAGLTYICVTAHTSGTFATDLTAGRWMVFSAASATQFCLSAFATAAAADAAALSAGGTVKLDTNYTATGDLTLSAPWVGAGGVLTRGAHAVAFDGGFEAPDDMVCFDLAGTGLITMPGKVVDRWYGKPRDGRRLGTKNVTCTTGSKWIVIAGITFAARHVGQKLIVNGAGVGAAALVSLIAAIDPNNVNRVMVADFPSHNLTASAQRCFVGTDGTNAVQQAFQSATASNGSRYVKLTTGQTVIGAVTLDRINQEDEDFGSDFVIEGDGNASTIFYSYGAATTRFKSANVGLGYEMGVALKRFRLVNADAQYTGIGFDLSGFAPNVEDVALVYFDLGMALNYQATGNTDLARILRNQMIYNRVHFYVGNGGAAPGCTNNLIEANKCHGGEWAVYCNNGTGDNINGLYIGKNLFQDCSIGGIYLNGYNHLVDINSYDGCGKVIDPFAAGLAVQNGDTGQTASGSIIVMPRSAGGVSAVVDNRDQNTAIVEPGDFRVFNTVKAFARLGAPASGYKPQNDIGNGTGNDDGFGWTTVTRTGAGVYVFAYIQNTPWTKPVIFPWVSPGFYAKWTDESATGFTLRVYSDVGMTTPADPANLTVQVLSGRNY